MHKGLNTLSYPLLILATKTDLPEAMNISEIAEALEVGKISDSGRTLAVKVRIMILNNYKNRSELM
jgi:signal recognition particle receptor subunit beta